MKRPRAERSGADADPGEDRASARIRGDSLLGLQVGDDAEEHRRDDGSQLADAPFEVCEELQSAGHKPFREAARVKDKRVFKRGTKNQPMEMSSKRPVPRLRVAEGGPGKRSCDPRFETLCGEFSMDRFRKQYNFLYDEWMPQESQQIKKKIKKCRNTERKNALKANYAQLLQQIRDEEARKDREAWEHEWKAKEKEAVKAGKKPYYLKESEKVKMDLVQKYNRLKEQGGLEKFMKKRRKRAAAKEQLANRKRKGAPKRRS
ncbi:unnamed protein product [Ostreobium quekettii]|uniref:rRNA biogenesis protein RRP36 n=1 Tax=Ostreobium quekettii TaxID=121088 RepID=A0A8S1ILA3_9CHLO|nr:unnamed protein product [Ostreobium quekettii]